MRTIWKFLGCFFLCLFCMMQSVYAAEHVYSVASYLNVREQPSANSKIVGKLKAGRWIRVLENGHFWSKIKLNSGAVGFAKNIHLTNRWIKIWKDERMLLLMSDKKILETYPVALGFNPEDDKVQQGDGATPLGRFFICEMLKDPHPKETYGVRSMRLSYPSLEDARRGLEKKLITKSQYSTILKHIAKVKMPPQNTSLGGSIRIHGGSTGRDWTLGCVAMKNEDIADLYAKIPSRNTMVEIYRHKVEEHGINSPNFTNKRILKGAKKILESGCEYSRKAAGIIGMDYPMGDFNPKIGVCTDVIIRALREIGIDLQALLWEDIVLNPERYPNISRPDTNIDHRRTRNLKIWLDHHALTLSNKAPADSANQWMAGDIVIMDTGVPNGTIFDHIGIVSDNKLDDRPLVINLWTIGFHVNEMDLLNGEYPTIVGHYRLTHPFDYDALP